MISLITYLLCAAETIASIMFLLLWQNAERKLVTADAKLLLAQVSLDFANAQYGEILRRKGLEIQAFRGLLAPYMEQAEINAILVSLFPDVSGRPLGDQ